MTINTIKSFLEVHKSESVESVHTELMQLILQLTVKPAKQSTSLIKHGKVIAIYCYYHKQWELVSEVAYGRKTLSTTGLNTMCKIGTNKWTKWNKQRKAVSATVLTLLEQGKIQASEIAEKKLELEAAIDKMDTENMPNGYASIDDIPTDKLG